MAQGVDASRLAIRDKLPPPPDVLVAAIAAEQRGQITTRQLRECGVNGDAVLRRVRRGWLHPIYRGVYAVGHAGITLEGRFMAAVLACGHSALLSNFSGSAYLGFTTWEDRLPEVTVIGTRARRIEGIRVHRARSLDPQDIWRHDGIPVTSPARTLLDIAPMLSERALRRAVRQAQALRRVSVRQLLDVLARSNGHPGVGALRSVVADGPAPTRSELEDRVLDLLDRAGIERPEINPGLWLDGSKVIPDFLWRDLRVVIEADGAAWHDHKLAREHDATRQAVLEAHGYRVVRVTWEQAVEHPRQTLARIRAALASG